MSVIVRCPSCQQLSRVAAEAIGLAVACPRCQHHFRAVEHTAEHPVASRSPGKRNPFVDPPLIPSLPPPNPTFWDEEPPLVHPHAGGLPFALALLPLGIPLIWLVIALLARPSVFSFAAPVAIAMSVCALGFGLANVRKWSAAVRSRAMLALVTLAYLAAGVLYFAQPEWLEGLRALKPRSRQTWQEYKSEDGAFRVWVPGTPTPTETPLTGWSLTAVRIADPKNPIDVFVVAHGDPPKEFPVKAADDVWFERVKESLLTAANATLVREQLMVVGEAKARDYELQFPGDATAKRVVRVIRFGGRLYYLGVDSPSVSLDALDVQQFWDSFKFTPAVKGKK